MNKQLKMRAHAIIEIITLIGSQGAQTTGVWAVGQTLVSRKGRYCQTNVLYIVHVVAVFLYSGII